MLVMLRAETVLSILAAIPTIYNLFISIKGRRYTDEQPLPPQFLNLPLRQLYGDISDLVSLKKLDPLRHKCFANLTHLELFADPDAWGNDVTILS
ncbi:hypothetical protein C8F01DRAFT_1373075 [Mycena amicta]|nr:hypothetical protein C8F01DRAFT_1373075 [Mycena amicta]